MKKTILGGIFLLSQSLACIAQACTVMEVMREKIPLNSTEIPGEARIKIAKMMAEARKWPDVEIRGIVEASAYYKEKNPQGLIARRTSALKDYLLMLGVKEENLWIQPHLLTDEMVTSRNGVPDIYQLSVTLVPICEGSCARLCNDPRVVPTTKLILE